MRNHTGTYKVLNGFGNEIYVGDSWEQVKTTCKNSKHGWNVIRSDRHPLTEAQVEELKKI